MRRSALVRVCLLLSAVACAGSLSAEGQEPTPATAEPGPQPPETAATLFDVAADLRWEQVLAEPVV
ncbi:MAG TPA: hypothetical protein VGE52_17885, partial [Pirellulales bacterium]